MRKVRTSSAFSIIRTVILVSRARFLGACRKENDFLWPQYIVYRLTECTEDQED